MNWVVRSENGIYMNQYVCYKEAVNAINNYYSKYFPQILFYVERKLKIL